MLLHLQRDHCAPGTGIGSAFTHPHVDVLLGGGLEEFDAQRLGEVLPALEGNDPLVFLE